MDPSPLLHTEIDNIRLDFQKLLNNLKEKLTKDQNDDNGHVEGNIHTS